MSSLRSRSFATLLLALFLGGCGTSWQPSTLAPRQTIEEERPDSVRVVHVDGSRWVIEDPAIQNDSIKARRDGLLPGIALEEVVSVEVRKVSASATALFVVATITALVLFANQWDPCFLSPDNCS